MPRDACRTQISLNPYQSVFFGTQHIYSEAYVQYFASEQTIDHRNDMPHIFQITRRAFDRLQPGKPQSMMVSTCFQPLRT